MLPLPAGSATWKFKTLKGITVDKLNPTQVGNADGKNCNTFTPIGGVNVTAEGVVADREFIDVIMGCDWIFVNMQADIYAAMVNSPKIPFTDKGAALIESIIRTRLNLAIKQGILADSPAPVVSVPKVADVSSADKTARRLTGITFQGTLAGAIHAVTVNGNVTV
jgi:hypothetical protein